MHRGCMSWVQRSGGSCWSSQKLLGMAQVCRLQLAEWMNAQDDSWSGGRQNNWRPLLPNANINCNHIKFAPQQQHSRQRPSSAEVTQSERRRFMAESRSRGSKDVKWMPAPHLSVSRGLINGWGMCPKVDSERVKPDTHKKRPLNAKTVVSKWRDFPAFCSEPPGTVQRSCPAHLKLDFEGEAVRKFDLSTQRWTSSSQIQSKYWNSGCRSPKY